MDLKEVRTVNKNYTILLNSIDKVKDFAIMINRFECDADLSSGRYIIDAKSIMGIFSLDLQNPLSLTVYENKDIETLEESLKPFLYKEEDE